MERTIMKHLTFFQEAFDGRKMFFNQWLAEGEPIANIALVHGLGEHSGRYEDFAQFFTSRNINVLAVDTFGHGQTEGKKGHTPKMEDYLWQIDYLIKTTKSFAPLVPTFLYGHSMGGCLVLNYLYKNKPDLAGVIASAPAIKPGFPIPKLKLLLGQFGRKFMPAFTQPNGLELNNLSHDKAIIDAYMEDPLVHNLVSGVVGIGIIEWGEWLLEGIKTSPVPLLVMHGEEDILTNFEASKTFCVKNDIAFKSWPKLYHEIHNEFEKEQVLQYALDWIKKI
ncbi:alpha/beta fold hydrolase [Lacihabitans sp. CCS-44]|uniref:alpha/beta hydrolase n=1 Tax=Lacihabitans sp. CCS-44 TaxID=2487331 RepID=UPI0020CB7876|nr:alpha/beta hydrolase [Lacihabitans sp. CCS-44]MCP9753756.1 alpha/beta fold hydrolase [Lacihabitans sp. CCS-44]